MQILVNHLTRMQPGRICFAGIDLGSGRHIRPVARTPLTTDLLESNGGPLSLGRVIDLGDSEFCGTVPEIEDRLCQPEQFQVIRSAPPAELHQVCLTAVEHRLQEIFGSQLLWIQHGPGQPGTAAVDQLQGIRSLGCYWAAQADLQIIKAGEKCKVRLSFQAGPRQFRVPVTDIRCYLADHRTPDVARINQLQQEMTDQPKTLVAVGLSRAYHNSADTPPRHWLQVNNIYPEAAP